MRIISFPLILIEVLLLALTGCISDSHDEGPDVKIIPLIVYTLVGSHAHDTASFTEGLLISNDTLFESTGSPQYLLHSRSVFGPVDLVSGKINVKAELDKEKYFGEGIAYLKGKFYQLTYTNGIGFIYDAATYELTGQFPFLSNEGWGLTTDGESLIMSDGTDKLTYIDPQTFLGRKILSVTEKGVSKKYLNELEFIRGSIYANVWLSNTIIKIDASNGMVTGMIDLSTLKLEAKSIYSGSREMNGIAFDPDSGHIFITGKLWPKIYEIGITE